MNVLKNASRHLSFAVCVVAALLVTAETCRSGEEPSARGTWYYLTVIRTALSQYEVAHSHLPDSLPQLCARDGCPFLPPGRGFTDSWGRPIDYVRTADSFELKSAGPDGLWGTPDDLVFSPKLERDAVVQGAGCYRSNIDWLSGMLVLDTTAVAVGQYRAEPGVSGVPATWTPIGKDSIWVRWNAVAWRELRVLRRFDTLRGLARWGGDASRRSFERPAVATRARCR